MAEELGLPVQLFLSGPLGGDQQVGAAIAEGRIDAVIFFWDPLEPHPHDVDVKALLRIAVVYNIAIACNRATADFVLSSPLTGEEYQRPKSAYEQAPKHIDPTLKHGRPSRAGRSAKLLRADLSPQTVAATGRCALGTPSVDPVGRWWSQA